jgi:hypothetical protein
MPINAMAATLPITAPAMRPAEGPEEPLVLSGAADEVVGDVELLCAADCTAEADFEVAALLEIGTGDGKEETDGVAGGG